MANLYLSVDNSRNGVTLCCESKICLFIHSIITKVTSVKVPYSVLLVRRRLDYSTSSPGDIDSFSVLGDNKFPVITMEHCPVAVQSCKLPVLVSSSGRMIHCGLCSILRKLVKLVHEIQSDLKLNKLLVSFL